MKQQINPLVAAVIIICVMSVVAFFFWKENQDAPLQEGPGIGRIGQTLNLGKTEEQLRAEGKLKPAGAKPEKAELGAKSKP